MHFPTKFISVERRLYSKNLAILDDFVKSGSCSSFLGFIDPKSAKWKIEFGFDQAKHIWEHSTLRISSLTRVTEHIVLLAVAVEIYTASNCALCCQTGYLLFNSIYLRMQNW